MEENNNVINDKVKGRLNFVLMYIHIIMFVIKRSVFDCSRI